MGKPDPFGYVASGMTEPSSAAHDLARRLLALETNRLGNANVDEASQVCEKLRVVFSRLSGPAAYSSLLQRALTLAQRAEPALRVVTVQHDGSLSGLDRIESDQSMRLSQGCRIVLVAHLLELLAILIGKPLMWQFALEAWPELSTDGDIQREKTK